MAFVSIVTHNSGAHLKACLRAALAQSLPVRIKVFDNASADGCPEIARDLGVEVEASPFNIGFSAAHNRNLLKEKFEYALVLNPDCIIDPDFIEKLQDAIGAVAGAGMAGGKLWRMDERGRPLTLGGHRILDSAGMHFTPAQRHFDRGSGQPDLGQYDSLKTVFGITGAAVLLSRGLLEDIRYENEYFDEDFFAYREDADLSWRAQLRGWKAVYQPAATGLHLRRVLPERRRRIDPLLNRHSLKNRYLMRRKNIDWSVRLRCFPYMWLRDVGIFGYVLLRERTSLGAYRDLWRLRARFAEKRAAIQAGRRVSGKAIARWFSFNEKAGPGVV